MEPWAVSPDGIAQIRQSPSELRTLRLHFAGDGRVLWVTLDAGSEDRPLRAGRLDLRREPLAAAQRLNELEAWILEEGE